MKTKSKKINHFLSQFLVVVPKPCEQKERPPSIPPAVSEAKAMGAAEKEKRKLQKDLENENGGAGVYSANMSKHYILANEEWKEGIMPEILDGHNVYNFVDLDILQRLEREEGPWLGQEADDDFEMDGKDLTPEEQEALAEIRRKRSLLIQHHRIKKSTAEGWPTVRRKFNKDNKFTSERMGRQLSALGLDHTSCLTSWKGEKSLARGDDDEGGGAMDIDVDKGNKKLCVRSRSLSRSLPAEVVLGEGFKDSAQKIKAVELAKKSVKKRNKDARRGEADRVITTLEPKHLLSGKHSIGKTGRH